MELAPEKIFVSLVFHFPLCFIVHINPEHCQLCETRVINFRSTAKYEELFKLIIFSADLQSTALLQWISILLSRSNLQHKQLLRWFVGTAIWRFFILTALTLGNEIPTAAWVASCAALNVNEQKLRFIHGTPSFPTDGRIKFNKKTDVVLCVGHQQNYR